MFSALKTAWTLGSGFMAAHRIWFIAGSVIAACGLVFGHLALDKMRNTKLEHYKAATAQLTADYTACQSAVASLNDRIAANNRRQQEALAAAAARVKHAEDLARLAAAERDVISEELQVTRFEVLEAIRDDEDMADWVDWSVPAVAWDRLRDAEEGRFLD